MLERKHIVFEVITSLYTVKTKIATWESGGTENKVKA
jgi:hypothetical protein